jgi:hypothetical protein
LPCRDKIAACDKRVQEQLQRMEAKADLQAHPLGPRPKGKRVRGNSPRFDLRTELYRVTGVDWTRVDGIDVQVAQTVIAEVGTDLRSFPGEKHFSKWLGLCPMNETSGGKVLKRRTPQRGQPGGDCPPASSLRASPQPELFRGAISPPANPTGSTQSHYRHGTQAGMSLL